MSDVADVHAVVALSLVEHVFDNYPELSRLLLFLSNNATDA